MYGVSRSRVWAYVNLMLRINPVCFLYLQYLVELQNTCIITKKIEIKDPFSCSFPCPLDPVEMCMQSYFLKVLLAQNQFKSKIQAQ